MDLSFNHFFFIVTGKHVFAGIAKDKNNKSFEVTPASQMGMQQQDEIGKTDFCENLLCLLLVGLTPVRCSGL
jgi:hypothetical protein